MKECTLLLKRGACLLILFAALVGCGHGGTEIGNPTGPIGTTPTAGDTGAQAPVFPTAEPPTPSPSAQKLLLKDSQDGGDQPEDQGALLNEQEENS